MKKERLEKMQIEAASFRCNAFYTFKYIIQWDWLAYTWWQKNLSNICVNIQN